VSVEVRRSSGLDATGGAPDDRSPEGESSEEEKHTGIPQRMRRDARRSAVISRPPSTDCARRSSTTAPKTPPSTPPRGRFFDSVSASIRRDSGDASGSRSPTAG